MPMWTSLTSARTGAATSSAHAATRPPNSARRCWRSVIPSPLIGVSLGFFEHGLAARRQLDGAIAAILDAYEAVDDGILPHRQMRAAVPALPGLRVGPRPLRDPAEELQHRQARRLSSRGLSSHRFGATGAFHVDLRGEC